MKNCIRTTLLFLAILFSFKGVALSDDSAKKIFLDFNGEKYTLNSFTFNSLFRNFFGTYAKPLDLTQGISFYLFPDFKFIYTEWGDIWEEKMIAEGTYTFKDGKIFLNYTYKHKKFEKELIKDTFCVLEGQIEKENYVMGHIFVLADEEEMKKLRRNENAFGYFQRRIELYDWQSIYSHFNNNKFDP